MARYGNKELIDSENEYQNCEIQNKQIYKLPKIIYIVIGIICIILIFSIPRNNENNKKQRITLNEAETELVSIINQIKLNDSMFKDICTKLYEVRKTKDTNGNTVYIFDMEAKTVQIAKSSAMDLLKKHIKGLSEENIERRKYYLKDNQFALCTFSGQDYKGQSAETLIAFSIVNSSIEEMWEKGNTYNEIDYEKILKSL